MIGWPPPYLWQFYLNLRLCTENAQCLGHPFAADDSRTDIQCLKIERKNNNNENN